MAFLRNSPPIVALTFSELAWMMNFCLVLLSVSRYDSFSLKLGNVDLTVSMMVCVSTGSLLMARISADLGGCSIWREKFFWSPADWIVFLRSAWLMVWSTGMVKRVMLPPVKSIPRFSLPLNPMKDSPPMMRMAERMNAGLRLLRKSIAFLGTRSMNLIFFRMPRSALHQKRTRVQRRDARSVPRIPMVRVTANPLTDPDACQNRMMAVMSVVTLASKIATNAFSYAAAMADFTDLPRSSSSLIRSYMRTLASTATPMVRMMPAIPGRVNDAPNAAMAPKRMTMLTRRPMSAMMPEKR